MRLTGISLRTTILVCLGKKMSGYGETDAQHVSLSNAAAVVYHWTVGKLPQANNVRQLNEVLGTVAHALSIVAQLYYRDGDSRPRPLQQSDLVNSTFDRGGSVLRKENGTELRGLTIRRADMTAAVPIFRRAGIRFETMQRETR
jgi:hypothetical protein